MTIYVECSCGQHWKARDEYAGKRGECRDCGQVLFLPIPEESSSATSGPAGGPTNSRSS